MKNRTTPRRTKILCTLGPAVSTSEDLVRLIYSGMDAARLNFSHGSHEDHLKMIRKIREASHIAKKHIPILQDLQGPKIRTGKMEKGGVEIADGQKFIITMDDMPYGNSKVVSTSYKHLIKEVQPKNTILLDDGYIILKVEEVTSNDIITRVVKGGVLKNNKGIIVPGASSLAPSLSEKDIEDLKFGLANDVDIVALSFVRSKRDLVELKAIMKIFGREVPIISKVERVEAIENIDEIIQESTAIMVARGDLGLEMPAEKLPMVQKDITMRCNMYGKPVIIATQMLESMIHNPRPTRAEASDVANAVLDGADMVMLSGETSVGKYPFETVGYMDRIIRNAEVQEQYHNGRYKGSSELKENISDAIGKAACTLAQQTKAAAIVTFTNSAYTAKNIVNYRPEAPIIALTNSEYICRRLSAIWGVTPVLIEEQVSSEQLLNNLAKYIENIDFVEEGDNVVYVAGLGEEKVSSQNMIKLVTI